MRYSPRTASIHTLDDDSILHVFYLYRPFFEDKDNIEDWNYNARWWYGLVHVCRRWRNILFGSAIYLGLSLLCTYGTPVADMLALSPPLPLLIGYFGYYRGLTSEDEEGIILALKQHGRVRRIRLHRVVSIMQRLSLVMDEEFPILEYLHITRPNPHDDNMTILRFPESLQAPCLRYLELQGCALPIGSRLLTTATGLVTLHLNMIHPSTYFHPNILPQWISLMPHLETLIFRLELIILHPDIERRLTHTSIIAPITLPNLHCFEFQGFSAYLEALVYRITAPRLEQLSINISTMLTSSIPRLLQFTNTAENLRFDYARVSFFSKFVEVAVNPYGETDVDVLLIMVNCWNFDGQVSSMAKISDSLGQIFSTVGHLSLQCQGHSSSSGEYDEAERTEWRKLLTPFSNVKTLQIQKALIKGLSRCLQLEDGELPLELLPELHELEYFGRDNTGDAFASFIDARRNAGRPVTLVRRSFKPTLFGAIL